MAAAAPAVDRIAVTTVVDNAIDSLRPDEKIARRFGHAQARRMPTLRAEHGLGHWVEVGRGPDTMRIAFDWGLTGESYTHNLQELGLDASGLDALALSHGHQDHWGGLAGFLRAHRRFMPARLPFYGGRDHFRPRWNVRDGHRTYIGRLDREELERLDLDVRIAEAPLPLAEGLWLSGEMHEALPFETIPASLRVEEAGDLVPDTFIGEQTLIANLRERGLVVITSCSHRGIVGICRHAVRITGVPRIHAVVGGFHLSGQGEERIGRVVDAFREFDLDYLVPQHCTGMEAMVALGTRLGPAVVWSSVGTTFAFAAPD